MSGPTDTLNVTVNGAPRSLFMSYGLLNELLSIVPDIPDVSAMGSDHALRGKVLQTILSKRNDLGDVIEPYQPFQVTVTPTDVHEILKWAQGHVLGFFLKLIEDTTIIHQDQEGALKKLMPSTDSGSG